MGNKVTLMWAFLQGLCSVLHTRWETGLVNHQQVEMHVTDNRRLCSVHTSPSKKALKGVNGGISALTYLPVTEMHQLSRIRVLHFLPPEQAHACKPSSDWTFTAQTLGRTTSFPYRPTELQKFHGQFLKSWPLGINQCLMWTIGTLWRP